VRGRENAKSRQLNHKALNSQRFCGHGEKVQTKAMQHFHCIPLGINQKGGKKRMGRPGSQEQKKHGRHRVFFAFVVRRIAPLSM